MTAAFADVISRGGIEATSAYGAYQPSQRICAFDASKVSVVLSGYTDLPANDENALLQVRDWALTNLERAVCGSRSAISAAVWAD